MSTPSWNIDKCRVPFTDVPVLQCPAPTTKSDTRLNTVIGIIIRVVKFALTGLPILSDTKGHLNYVDVIH